MSRARHTIFWQNARRPPAPGCTAKLVKREDPAEKFPVGSCRKIVKKGYSGEPDNNIVLHEPVLLGDRREERDKTAEFRP